MPNREPGNVQPTRRTVSPVNPSIVPSAFGEGIGRALGNIASSYQQAALLGQKENDANASVALAYKGRQDKLARANLDVQFLEITQNLKMALTEDYKNAAPGAPGLTNAFSAKADKELDTFLRSVPDQFKPEYMVQIENAKNVLANSAFSLQTSAENAEFQLNSSKFSQLYINKLLGDPITSLEDLDAVEADALENIEKLFKNSPLTKTETRDLRQQTLDQLKTAKFARIAREEANGNFSAGGQVPGRISESNGVVKATSAVAAGLPPQAVGFLDAIAEPESGGEYNALYSPNERRYFQDFSQHPNDPAVIYSGPHAGEKSSAAGRYMMIKGTWERAQAALGLTDFSPQNQDHAAWWVAQQDYFAATGRSLSATLASGDQVAILEAKRLLSSTWTGLKQVSDQQFLAKLNGATGNPSSLVNDPEFASIPYDQRVALAIDAQAKAIAQQTALANQQKAITEKAYNDLQKAIAAGDAGMAEINQFAKSYNATYDQQQKLEKILQEQNEQAYNASKAVAVLQNNSFNGSEEQKNQLRDFYTIGKMEEALASGDQSFVNDVLIPVTRQTHYIPPNIAQALKSLMSSANPQQALFALDTMNQLRGTDNFELKRAIGDEAYNATVLFNYAKSSLPQDQLLSYIRNQADPAMQPLRNLRKTQIDKVVKDNPDDFTPQGIISSMDYEGAVSPELGQALAAEAWPLYQYFFDATGDHSTAQDAVADVLKSRYGDAQVNGRTQFMRFPPTITAQPFNGNYDYVDEQLRRDFGLTPDDNVALVSDGLTEAQFKAGQPASYKLVKKDERGLVVGIYTRADMPDFDPKTDAAIGGRVVRWSPKITPQMINDQVDVNLAKDKLQKLRLEAWNAWEEAYTYSLEEGPGFKAPPEDLQKRIAAAPNLEAQIEYGKKEFFRSETFYAPLKRLLAVVPDAAVNSIGREFSGSIINSREQAIERLSQTRQKLLALPAGPHTYQAVPMIDKMLKELNDADN